VSALSAQEAGDAGEQSEVGAVYGLGFGEVYEDILAGRVFEEGVYKGVESESGRVADVSDKFDEAGVALGCVENFSLTHWVFSF
jgi:hypothetical protein